MLMAISTSPFRQGRAFCGLGQLPGIPMLAEYMVHKESDGLHRLFPYLPLTARAKNDGAPGSEADSFPGFTGPIPIAGYHGYRVISPSTAATALDVTLTVPRAARACFVSSTQAAAPLKA